MSRIPIDEARMIMDPIRIKKPFEVNEANTWAVIALAEAQKENNMLLQAQNETLIDIYNQIRIANGTRDRE